LEEIRQQALRREELLTISQMEDHLSAAQMIMITLQRKTLEIESKDVTKFENFCDDTGILTAIQRTSGDISSRVPKSIMTPGLFPLMELPTELRLKVYSPFHNLQFNKGNRWADVDLEQSIKC
jgi:hypothetical protein